MLAEALSFIKKLKCRKDVLQLIQRTDMTIVIAGGEETIYLSLKNGEAALASELGALTFELTGSQQALTDLFEGNRPLRQLIMEKRINLKAPFRTLLLLESIFYLTKPLQKII